MPYRYPDDDLIDALNIGLLEARRLRADLFLPLFDRLGSTRPRRPRRILPNR